MQLLSRTALQHGLDLAQLDRPRGERRWAVALAAGLQRLRQEGGAQEQAEGAAAVAEVEDATFLASPPPPPPAPPPPLPLLRRFSERVLRANSSAEEEGQLRVGGGAAGKGRAGPGRDRAGQGWTWKHGEG